MNSLLYAQKTYTARPQLSIAGMHTHDHYEIFCFLGGDARYSVEGNIYNLEPGDILIMKRAEAHSLIVDSPVPYCRIVTHFYPTDPLGENPGELLKFIDERPLGKFNCYSAAVFPQTNWLYYMEKIAAGNPDEQRAFLTVLLHELKDAYPRILDRAPGPDDFSRIIAFINDNIAQPISLEDICRYAFLSKSQLNRKFAAVTGTTAWEYITIKRLMLAKEYLRNGQHPTSVYLKCGFNDYSAFYRAYRARFGFAPSKEFKKK